MISGASCIEIDPNNKNRVLILSGITNPVMYPASQGLYLSDDMGDSYKQVLPIYSGEFREIPSGWLKAIAFDKKSFNKDINGSSTVYFSSGKKMRSSNGSNGKEESIKYQMEIGLNEGPGLYRSDDGGETWKMINDKYYDSMLAVNPDSSVLYLGNADGFFISEDKGVTFKRTFEKGVCTMTTTDTKPNNVYICDEDRNFYVSSDAGKTFKKVGTIPEGDKTKAPHGLSVSSANPENMMVGGGGADGVSPGAYYSNDGGKTWNLSAIDDSLEYFRNYTRDYSFFWDPTDPNKVWDAGHDCIYVSDDAGKNFIWNGNGDLGAAINSQVGHNVYNPDILFVPIQDNAFSVSFDGGDTFIDRSKTNMPISNHCYGGYAVDENTWFFGRTALWGGKPSIVITRDGGQTFEETGIQTQYIYGYENSKYTQSASDPNVWFADDYRSADAGKTWTKMSPGTINMVTYNISNPSEIFGVCKEDEKMYPVVSYDNGTTWSAYADLHEITGVDESIALSINDMAYDHDEGALYILINYPLEKEKEKSFGVFTPAPNWIYSTQVNEVWKVYNDGRKENITANARAAMKESNSAPVISKYMNVTNQQEMCYVTIDPRHPEIVYISAMKLWAVKIDGEVNYQGPVIAGTIRSCDGGKTWQNITTNPDPDLSVVNSGMFYSFDNRKTWVNPKNGELWAIDGNRGMAKFPPPYIVNDSDKPELDKKP